MKHSKVSAETRDKTIKEADLGVVGWALRGVRRAATLRKKKAGKVPTGELAYRGGQILLGLAIFLALKAAFGVPFNFVSEFALLCFLVGAQFGAVRFSFFSLVYWGVVGSILGFAIGVWPLSPSWWQSASEGWANGQPIPKIVVGAAAIATIVWVAAGRLASKGMGSAFVEALENWTFRRGQDAQKQRESDVEAEFEKAGVSRAEVDDLARRNEADRRRAVVFGGSLRRRRPESEGVSLAKSDDVPVETVAADPAEASRRIADLAGHVEDKDADVLAGLASGPDFGMLGTTTQPAETDKGEATPSPSLPLQPSYEDDDIPGPSANGIVVLDDDDDIPGPSNASSGSAATAIIEVAEKVEAPIATVSAPKINPEASRGRRRMSREDLGKMIDLFNIMSREDSLEKFVTATRSKLVRLTDEDYEELRTLDGGEALITLSQDLKLGDQARGRTAVVASVTPEPAPEPETTPPSTTAEVEQTSDQNSIGNDTNMPNTSDRQPVSSVGADLVNAIDLMRGAASGRVPLGAAPKPVADAPVEGEVEDYENEGETAPASTPDASVDAVPPAPVATEADERPHEISAVTARGESVSFEVDITENESTDADMRRYPTPYASERVSILNNSSLSDEHKIERLRALDRTQSVSTVEMFEGDDIASLLNLPAKVMKALREKVHALLGERPSDMNRLQSLLDRRIELVQKQLFERPHEYQRILSEFTAAGVGLLELVERLDTPQAREVMENSIRLDPWFEQNLAGVRLGRLKAALPLPAKGPGVLDRFSGTVDAAMRGAGLPGTGPSTSEASRAVVEQPARPSEVIVDVAPRQVAPVEAIAPKVEARRYEKGVDAQWTPDAPPGSEVYVQEMAEHFSMIVKRNDTIKAQAERDQREAAERQQREAREQEERERIEGERRRREEAENDRARRAADFFARLPRIEGGHFVKSLPARFMTDDIMAAVTGIVDGQVIADRMQKDHVAQKVAFLNQWKAEKGTDPDPVDELSWPVQKRQADVAIQNGERAGELLSHIAEACGLQSDALVDEIKARLADEEEREFVRQIVSVRNRGEEVRVLLEASERRTQAALLEAAREEARRQLKLAAPADGERVQKLETDLEQRDREMEELRRNAQEASERAAAAEKAAADKEAAVAASMKAAADMAEKVRELEARIVVEDPSVASDADVEEGVSEAQLQAFLAEQLDPLNVGVDLKVYTGRIDIGLAVVIDLPDDVAAENEIVVGDRRLPLAEGIRRFVLRNAAAVDPLLDNLKVVVVTDAPLAPDMTGSGMGIDDSSMDVCARDAKALLRLLRGAYGLAVK